MADPSESTTRILDTGADDPLIGRRVRDFRVLERIGRGGMGSVYKAEHRWLRELRAIKVMRAELFHALPNSLERFEREARIAVRLRHPNLVLLYDFFVEHGDHFLVMEYVVGKSLATRMREQGPLSLDETCQIGLQICAGLAHAHEMGVVHRDLSPENVMITPTPSGPLVRIIDFGVARAAFADAEEGDGDATLTRVGQFIGKPRYASPEQAGSLRRGETLDARSDLYTLGLMLFEMLTERFPFQSDSDLGYLAKHSFEPPASPRALRPDLSLSPALERVILHCLEKDRARRFASARELAAALEWAWRSGDPRTAPFGRDARRGGDEEPTRPLALADYEQPEAETRVDEPELDEPELEEAELDEAPGRRPALIAGLALLTLLGVGAAGGAWWLSARDDPGARVVSEAVAEPPKPTAPAAEPEPAAEPTPAISPAPLPEAEKRAELAAAGIAPAPPEPPAIEPEPPNARPSPRVAEPVEPAKRVEPVKPVEPARPIERAKPPAAPVPAFADAAEMQRAFDEAVAFERTHDAKAAVANWKRFRSRSPSADLDDRAKRRITELTLGGLRGYP